MAHHHVFLHGIPAETTARALAEHLCRFGTVSCRLEPRGSAFAIFEDAAVAAELVARGRFRFRGGHVNTAWAHDQTIFVANFFEGRQSGYVRQSYKPVKRARIEPKPIVQGDRISRGRAKRAKKRQKALELQQEAARSAQHGGTSLNNADLPVSARVKSVVSSARRPGPDASNSSAVFGPRHLSEDSEYSEHKSDRVESKEQKSDTELPRKRAQPEEQVGQQCDTESILLQGQNSLAPLSTNDDKADRGGRPVRGAPPRAGAVEASCSSDPQPETEQRPPSSRDAQEPRPSPQSELSERKSERRNAGSRTQPIAESPHQAEAGAESTKSAIAASVNARNSKPEEAQGHRPSGCDSKHASESNNYADESQHKETVDLGNRARDSAEVKGSEQPPSTSVFSQPKEKSAVKKSKSSSPRKGASARKSPKSKKARISGNENKSKECVCGECGPCRAYAAASTVSGASLPASNDSHYRGVGDAVPPVMWRVRGVRFRDPPDCDEPMQSTIIAPAATRRERRRSDQVGTLKKRFSSDLRANLKYHPRHCSLGELMTKAIKSKFRRKKYIKQIKLRRTSSPMRGKK